MGGSIISIGVFDKMSFHETLAILFFILFIIDLLTFVRVLLTFHKLPLISHPGAMLTFCITVTLFELILW